MEGPSGPGCVQDVNSSGSSVVTNPISWRVDLAGPARQVQKLARRLIAQIADRVRISAGGPAAVGCWAVNLRS